MESGVGIYASLRIARGEQKDSPPDGKAAMYDELGSVDAPDFLIKLDKSFAKMLELVMRA